MRVQMELKKSAVKFLDELKVKLGLATRVEAIKYALSLLNWMVKETEAGREISSIDKVNNVIRIPIFPGLDILLEKAKVKTQKNASIPETSDDNDILAIFKRIRDRKIQSINEDLDALFDLAIAYNEMGLYEEALSSLIKAQATSNTEKKIKCLDVMSTVYQNLNNLPEAIECLKDAKKLADEINLEPRDFLTKKIDELRSKL
ncbi:MAG: tetratricopeptide repeat protein [Candidatus Parcubacteria bacterium]|nr:tetratricopeptide repeat protein [Candidatus Parcubacteria bacterium]